MGSAPPNNTTGPVAGMPLLALGFRPFYLFAAVYALLAVPAWLLSYASGMPLAGYLQGMTWHSHEMIFGFVPAVVAGFLLTAVRNWTGRPTPAGAPLAGLVSLWLLARVLIKHPKNIHKTMFPCTMAAVIRYSALENGLRPILTKRAARPRASSRV